MNTRPILLSTLFFVQLAITASCKSEPQLTVDLGKDLYPGCVSCHGQKGEGDTLVNAPAIAGLPAWYVEAQLFKFRTGLRGAHPDDVEGLKMRPMSRQMADDREVKAVAAYIASMPVQKTTPKLNDGKAEVGKTLYGTCMACHGVDGKGNVALKAPPIVQLNDWYLLAQIKKFKGGIRGVNPGDVTGNQMRPMAGTLPDEQAMKNVIAYIGTLAK